MRQRLAFVVCVAAAAAACTTRVFPGSPRSTSGTLAGSSDGAIPTLPDGAPDPFLYDDGGYAWADTPDAAPPSDEAADAGAPADAAADAAPVVSTGCAAVDQGSYTPGCGQCAAGHCCAPITACATPSTEGGTSVCTELFACLNGCTLPDAGTFDGGLAECENDCVAKAGDASIQQVIAVVQCMRADCASACQ